jgi:hypothetical protein
MTTPSLIDATDSGAGTREVRSGLNTTNASPKGFARLAIRPSLSTVHTILWVPRIFLRVYRLSLRSLSPNLPTSRPDANRGGRDADGLGVLPERCEKAETSSTTRSGKVMVATWPPPSMGAQEAPGELLICDPGN